MNKRTILIGILISFSFATVLSLVAIILTPNNEGQEKNKINFAKTLSENIYYIKDRKTDLCFAIILVDHHPSYQISLKGFIQVPCEQVKGQAVAK